MPRGGTRCAWTFRARLALAAGWLLAAACPARAADAPRWAEGQVIVNFTPEATPTQRAAILSALDAEVIRTFHNIPAALCRLRTGTTAAAVETSPRLPGLRRVEPNGALSLDGVPDDPLFGRQYYLHHVAGQLGLPGADIRAAHAWDVERGSRAVVVGVIDETINLQHPDLVDHIYTNPGEIPGNGVDDDANGWIDDVHGPQPLATFGTDHGTACAGIIAASTGNGVGVAGLADVTIMPLRLGWVADYHAPWIAAVIGVTDYAIDMGVDVISLSAGDTDVEYLALHDIFAAAGQHGIYMVMSAGNSQGQMTQPQYPACFEDIDRIISVGATDIFDDVTYNWHPTWVDLAAPGYVGATCALNGGYTSFGGTSASAPQVAGVLALLLSKHRDEPGFDAKARLLASVDVLPSLAGKNLTGGRLNAFLAVADPDDTAPAPAPALTIGRIASNRAVAHWRASGDDGPVGRASEYDLRISTSPIDEASFAAATPMTGLPYPGEPGALQSAPLSGLAPNTTYHVALRVLDEWGSYRRRVGGDVRPNASALTTATFTTITAPTIEILPTEIGLDIERGQTATRTFDIRNTGQDVLTFAVNVPEGAGIVTCAPTSGRLAPGATTVIAVTVAPGNAPCGRAIWPVEVRSNDPAAPVRTVSVTPGVVGDAVAVLTTTTLEFGVVAVGQVRRSAPALRNDGCEPLRVRAVTRAGSGDFTYGGPQPLGDEWLVLLPGETLALPVQYRPSDFGDDAATFTLATSAAATPLLAITAHGRGATPSRAVFSAAAVTSRTMYTGAVDTVRLTLANEGGADLDFAVRDSLPSWLRVEPPAGILAGGTSRQLAFVLSAAGACADDSATVVIATSDTDLPIHAVSTRLKVLPGSHLEPIPLRPFSYDQDSQTLVIWNLGCPDHMLWVSHLSVSAAGAVSVEADLPIRIEPGGAAYVELWSEDCWGGDGFVRLLSSDPDQPEVHVPFTYDCGPQPGHPVLGPGPLADAGRISACPNPFNPTTTLRLVLDREATVAACVFDLAGRCVWRQELGVRGPGLVEAEWRGRGTDGARLASGAYFGRFDLGEGRWSALVKMTLLK